MRDDLEGFPQELEATWYFARDGQQFGPLSDAELKKFNELGYLRADDLVWRKGFAHWRPAGEVFEIGAKP